MNVGPSEPVSTSPSVPGVADGGWQRLHPATPLLRGGIALIAIAGVLIANFRERILEGLLGAPGYESDPIGYLSDEGYLPIGLLVVLGVVLLAIALFYVSWRMHTFRVTGELVEVRSGVVFRTHRRARLDRIQGVNIQRPLFARLFGTAKLDVQVAGEDANVQLAYLGSARADELRAEVLRLASGTQRAKAQAVAVADPDAPAPDAGVAAAPTGAETDGSLADGVGPGGTATGAAGAPGFAAGRLVDRRVHEFLAPELDPGLAEPESVVTMHPGRLIGSTVLSGTMIFFVLTLAALVVGVVLTGEPWFLFGLIPALFGMGSYLINRVVKSLRYSIAGTADGVRVGFGLLSTSNETLPPGRIHSISVSQPLLWRPFDWWHLQVNRASRSSTQQQQNQQSSTVLPVGSRADALRVLALLTPDIPPAQLDPLVAAGFAAGSPDDGFTTSPRRAAVLRWFSWRRNGFAVIDGAVLLRRGAIWREVVLVPTPRMQSVAVQQGPLLRRLGLAAVTVHTVAGPISAQLGALDRRDAERFFGAAALAGITAAALDRTHRWGSGADAAVDPEDFVGTAGAAATAGTADTAGTVDSGVSAAPDGAATPGGPPTSPGP